MNVRLELHHVLYRSQQGPDTEENLILLCDEHHRLMHSNKKRWQPVLLAVLHAYYEEDLFITVLEAERQFKKRLVEFPAVPD